MSAALDIILFIGIGVGLPAWFAILIYGIKTVRHTRQGVSIWGRETGWNPANVLLRPALLTDEGKAYHRKCFIAVVVFVISVGLPVFIATLAEKL